MAHNENEQTPEYALNVGERFTHTTSRTYTVDGVKVTHTRTVLGEVTSVNPAGFDYRAIESVAEEGRPSFATDPAAGSIAWFVVPIYVARGDLTIMD